MKDYEEEVIRAAEYYRDSPTSIAFNALCHAVDTWRAKAAARETAEEKAE